MYTETTPQGIAYEIRQDNSPVDNSPDPRPQVFYRIIGEEWVCSPYWSVRITMALIRADFDHKHAIYDRYARCLKCEGQGAYPSRPERKLILCDMCKGSGMPTKEEVIEHNKYQQEMRERWTPDRLDALAKRLVADIKG